MDEQYLKGGFDIHFGPVRLNDSLEWLTTQDHELKARELEEFTAHVKSENFGIVSLHHSVMVFESDELLSKSHVGDVAAIRQMYGAEALVESFDTAKLFFAWFMIISTRTLHPIRIACFLSFIQAVT
ncbi:MAG: hypothetical protein ACLFT3_07380 [Cyclobacteriaceae bacterium]